jgi:hypothetical protein
MLNCISSIRLDQNWTGAKFETAANSSGPAEFAVPTSEE